jgi:hypothetical protein
MAEHRLREGGFFKSIALFITVLAPSVMWSMRQTRGAASGRGVVLKLQKSPKFGLPKAKILQNTQFQHHPPRGDFGVLRVKRPAKLGCQR